MTLTHHHRPASALGALFLAYSLIACGGNDDAPRAPNFPEVVSATSKDEGPIFRSLSVVMAAPGPVEVEYWTGTGQHLVMHSERQESAHEIMLPRLRPNATYYYQVRTKAESKTSDVKFSGQFTTGDLPADLKEMKIKTSGAATQALTFMTIRSKFNGGVIFDSDGEIVWYARTTAAPQGATRRANGNWVIQLNGSGLFEYSPQGKLVASLPQSRLPADTQIHHGTAATPQNTLLFLVFEPRVFNGVALMGEGIWEWNPQTDVLARRWLAFDMLDPALDFGPRSKPADWFHANAVVLGLGGNILVSFHYLDQIISIAPDYSKIEWRLGGPGSTLTVLPSQKVSGQHSPRETLANQILMFDNGYARDDGAKYSRAVELKFDTGSKAVTTVWEYRPSPDIWSSVISSVRRAENGNTIVNFGRPTLPNVVPPNKDLTGPIAIHEVGADRKMVWSANVSMDGASVFQADPMQSLGGETAKGSNVQLPGAAGAPGAVAGRF